jgi:uncharacterized protein (TIGR03437 family)
LIGARITRRWLGTTALLSLAAAASAQNSTPAWHRIAGTTLNEGLSGPAAGPVSALWYAPGTGALLAQTASGRIFETSDFTHWKLNTSAAAPSLSSTLRTPALPESGAKLQSSSTRLYATGTTNLYASEDSGRTWLNLTGFNNRSVIGSGFTALAIPATRPQELAAANQYGVWRSLDGGLSWHSLNEDLPNLIVRKLIDRRTIELADGTLAISSAGAWSPNTAADPETAFIAKLNGSFTAAVKTTTITYAGAADGRLLASRDEGATWSESNKIATSGIARIWVDADRPEVALAASGARLLRTINGGLFWDDVTGTSPGAQIHGIAADRSASVVYIATDRGVFTASLSLNDAGPAVATWQSVSAGLPAAPAWDVLLNADNTLTVALDGYGVFETQAPHRSRRVRVVNAADMSDRAAAPGSLVSVLNASISRVTANGSAYPVIAASEQNSQLQIPFETPVGTLSLSLESAGNRWSVPLQVKEAAPAIFVDAEGAPLLLDGASGLVMDPGIAITASSTIQVLATGLGKVSPEWPSGVPAPLDAPPIVTGFVTAFLDGTPVTVNKATLAPGYVGYYMVELQIPAIVNRGANELRIVMNGEESNRVKVFLEPDLAPR